MGTILENFLCIYRFGYSVQIVLFIITLYLVLDPITSIAPKFSSTTNIQGFKTQLDNPFNLLCPAQGYPVPISRWVGCY